MKPVLLTDAEFLRRCGAAPASTPEEAVSLVF